MTISVIVPVYNAEDTLRRCVDSILSQEMAAINPCSLEIILVDDGSTDDSPGICDDYAEKDPRIRVVHQKNGGLCRAWNAGVDISTGEYLVFVDSDDWIESGMLKSFTAELKDGYEGQIICCNALEEHSDGRTIRVSHAAPPGEYTGKELLVNIKRRILGNSRRTVHFSRCLRLVPTELIKKNRHYCDPAVRMGEDVNIMLPVLLDADRLVILKDSYYYHYTYNDSSMAHGYDARMEENTDRLMSVVEKVLSDREDIIPKDMASEMTGREKSCLYMLELKNALRENRRLRMNRLLQWAEHRDIKKHLLKYPVETYGMEMKLLSFAMSHPGKAGFMLLSAVYDAKTAGKS